VRPLKVTFAVPESVTVRVCAALVVAVGVAKVRVLLARVVPERVTVATAVVVLLEPLPHPARMANPAITKSTRTNMPADCHWRVKMGWQSVILSSEFRLVTSVRRITD
jgi:hypothetical protein